MKIVLLNGDPDITSPFSSYLQALEQMLKVRGHAAERIDLALLDLKGCTGCFGCWLKTPGKCVKRDDSARICRVAISSDLLLLAAPMKMGFTSALLKRAADQMIPTIHPYIVVEGGEAHHRARYEHYSALALLVEPDESTDTEDIEITTEMWRRMARNMKTRLAFAVATSQSVEEVADEIALTA